MKNEKNDDIKKYIIDIFISSNRELEYKIKITVQFLEDSFKLLLSSIYDGIIEIRIHFILVIILQYTNNISSKTNYDLFEYFQSNIIMSLFRILFEGWDEVRDITISLLLQIPISKYSEININEILKWLLVKTKSFKPKDCDGSGKLFYFLYSKYVVENNIMLNLLNYEIINQESNSNNNNNKILKQLNNDYTPPNNQLLFINEIFILLFRRLPLCISEKDNYDELNIRNIPIIQGLLCCLKYIYNSNINILKLIPNEIVNIYLNILIIVYKYVCYFLSDNRIDNIFDEKYDDLESEDDTYKSECGFDQNRKLLIDCRGHIITDNDNDMIIQTPSIITASWLSCRECSMLIAYFIQSYNYSTNIISNDLIIKCSNILISSLLTVKHLGAILYISESLELVVKSLLQSNNNEISKYVYIYYIIFRLPSYWLMELLNNNKLHKIRFILRRSVGYVKSLISILKAEKTNSKHVLLHNTIQYLISLLKEEKDDNWKIKVHSLNVLKGIVSNSILSPYLSQYYSELFVISVNGFNSEMYYYYYFICIIDGQ